MTDNYINIFKSELYEKQKLEKKNKRNHFKSSIFILSFEGLLAQVANLWIAYC